MITYACPACGKWIESPEGLMGQASKCPHCGASLRVPAAPADAPPLPASHASPPPHPPYAGRPGPRPWINPITEFGVFAMVFPVVMAGVSAFTFFLLGPPGAPPIMGVSRGVFFGVPIFGSAAICMIAGILLLATRSLWSVLGCVIAGSLIAVSYITVNMIGAGRFTFDLMSFVLLAVPVFLIIRCPKAIAEIRRLRHGPPLGR